MGLCRQETDTSVQDPKELQDPRSRSVDWCPPLLLNLTLALQVGHHKALR